MDRLPTIVIVSSDLKVKEPRLLGIYHGQDFRERLNASAIALREKKGIRELNVGQV
jgi:hypothetical protein